MRIELLLGLLFGAVATAHAQTAAVSNEFRPTLELKGIKLGDDLAAVRAALPAAKCETLKDPSLSECWLGKGGTIGGKPAQLLVRLLDGKVVYIIAVKMTQEDAYAVIDGLKAKYGAPDDITRTRVTLVRPMRDQSLVYERPAWVGDNGNHILTIQPANYTDQNRKFTYAAVSLVDVNGHDVKWMANFNGDARIKDL